MSRVTLDRRPTTHNYNRALFKGESHFMGVGEGAVEARPCPTFHDPELGLYVSETAKKKERESRE